MLLELHLLHWKHLKVYSVSQWQCQDLDSNGFSISGVNAVLGVSALAQCCICIEIVQNIFYRTNC